MIYAINQKARWLLYYFAVRETTEKYIRLSDDQLDDISKQITGELIDDNSDIKKAVSDAFSHMPDMNSDTENLIIKGIAGLIQKYEEAPSHPMIYR